MTTLIATTYNAEEGLIAWCESIMHQTVKPDNIVIVDGGSTDGTLSILRGYPFQVLYRPDLNIKHHHSPVAAGRNAAIFQTRENDIILCVDAGTVLAHTWVENITKPFADPLIDVVGGNYMAIAKTPFEYRIWKFLYRKSLPASEFSSRSLAFRRYVWFNVGGYPEYALTAEDTLFNQRIKGFVSTFASEALVYWRVPQTWKAFARMQYRYAKGDAVCRLRTWNYVQIFGKYAIALVIAWVVPLYGVPVVALGFLLHNKDPRMKLVSDVSKMVGYIHGLIIKGFGLCLRSSRDGAKQENPTIADVQSTDARQKDRHRFS